MEQSITCVGPMSWAWRPGIGIGAHKIRHGHLGLGAPCIGLDAPGLKIVAPGLRLGAPSWKWSPCLGLGAPVLACMYM